MDYSSSLSLTRFLSVSHFINEMILFQDFDPGAPWNEIVQRVYRQGEKSTPSMVFYVIGDSKSFVPRPWRKAVFQTGLIEAAKEGGGIVNYMHFRNDPVVLSKTLFHLTESP